MNLERDDLNVTIQNAIPKFIEDCCVNDNDLYSINYKLAPSRPVDETDSTVAKDIVVIATIKNKTTGQEIRVPITILKLPIKMQFGYKIGGTMYTAIGVDKRSSGWYITEEKENKEVVKIMEFIPTTGLNIKMVNKCEEIIALLGNVKETQSRVPLGVFLKAVTGKTYSELINLLGVRNEFIQASFTKEYDRDECIDACLKSITHRDSLDLVSEYKYSELMQRLYSPRYIQSGDALARTLRNTAFRARALNMELGKDILNYKAGITLTEEILDEIDNSDIDTLFVRYDKKLFELKKFKITSDKSLSEPELLTMVNMYCCALAGFPGKDSRYELYNRQINSFYDSTRDAIFNNLNKITSRVSDHFMAYNVNTDLSELTLPSERELNPYVLINSFKSSDSNDSQTSETTNYLAAKSMEYKVSSDYKGRASEEMIGVKDSETGIYDPYQMPESKKVGFVHYLTLNSKDVNGEKCGKYVRVKNGNVDSDDIVYLTPYQITNSYIAPWDSNLDADEVPCYYMGRVVTVKKDKVQYQEYSCLNNISLPTAMISFMNYSDGKRVVMGGNHSKQALLTINRERPLVSTGVCGLLGLGVETAQYILQKYYVENSAALEGRCSLEDFMKSTIKIVSSDLSVMGYRTLIMKVTCPNGEVVDITHKIPFCRRTTENTHMQFTINSKPNFEYSGNDIVVYDNSFDIKKYDLDYYVNMGNQKVDDNSVFDTDMALGNNYLVAWKTWQSSNLDDGIVINGGLLGTNKLAHIILNQIETECKITDKGIEKFEKPSKLLDFEQNGLPKIGTYLKPNSVVIGKTLVKQQGTTDVSVRLDSVTEGEVIKAYMSSDKQQATVIIARVVDAEVGDKLTGNHGNKGVIAKIVPEGQMPYLAESGRPIDILLNPLGVPSRMNISQFLEGVFGLAMHNKGENHGCVVTPQYCSNDNGKSCYDIALELAEQFNAKPRRLRDGRTGKLFPRESMVGMLYMKKLTHTSTSKFNSTGMTKKINPITGQPQKGKNVSGGQKVGEMELWSLAASGADKLIQELMSTMSDDIDNVKNAEAYANDPDNVKLPQGTNNNDAALYALLRPLGVDIVNSKEDGSYKIKIMKDSDIRALASKPIANNDMDLHNVSIFGSNPKEFNSSGRFKWGYMDLKCEIVNPLFIYKGFLGKLMIVNEVKEDNGELTLKYRSLSCDSLRNIIDNKAYLAIEEGKVYFSKKCDGEDRFNWLSGLEVIVDALKILTLDDAYFFYSSICNKMDILDEDKKEDVYTIEQMLDIISGLKEQDMELKDFIISSYPILPRVYRISSDKRKSGFDKFYSSIIAQVESVKGERDAREVYYRILEFIGLDGKHQSKSADAGCKTLLQYFAGAKVKGGNSDSKGYFRTSALSKVVRQSYRSVIVPAEAGLITPLQVGLPLKIAVNCLRSFLRPLVTKVIFNELGVNITDYNTIDDIINSVVNEDFTSLRHNLIDADSSLIAELGNKETLRKLLLAISDVMVNYIETEGVTALGRQPTLHMFGIKGFRIKVVKGNAIHIHPLTCSTYNADFDGDQMWGVIPISNSARLEILEKMSPRDYKLNPKDGSYLLTPEQDTLLGCYLSTMLHENKTSINDYGDRNPYDLENVIFYDSIEQIKYDIEFEIIKLQDLVCYKNKENGHKYLSTAGRIIFNSLIPNCFTDEKFTNTLGLPVNDNNDFYELKFDGLIKKKKDKSKTFRTFSITNVLDYIYSLDEVKSDGARACLILDDILKFGVNCCDRSGMSLTLEDFIQHPQVNSMNKKAKVLVDKINHYYDMGLITAEDRKASSEKIYKYLTGYIQSTLLSYYDRNNNLFIIIDSGSRGNLGQLMKSCGLVGSISRNSNESIETPVISNYSRGLKSFEQMIVSFGTRMGVSGVQNDTEKAGALTRNTVYALANLNIVEHDCGNVDDLEVDYSDEFLSCEFNGQPVDIIDLFDQKIKHTDENYIYYLSLNANKLEDLKLNSNCVYYIKKNKIRVVELEGGTLKLRYKLSSMFKSLINNRVGYDLEGLIKLNSSDSNEGYVTQDTIKFIENHNLEKVKIRTIMRCHSSGGVCAKCYGLKETNKKLPRVGERVGVISAQAIGEPATQLQLETINRAGAAGANASSGVDVFKSRVKGSTPSGQRAIISKSDNIVEVRDIGKDTVLITNGKDVYQCDKSLVKVKDGEFVRQGDMLANGVVDVNDIQIGEDIFTEETLKRRQMALLNIFYGIFMASDIDLNARNFEALVRVQLSIGKVVGSEDPNFIPGRSYFITDLQKAKGKVFYYSEVEKSEEVINKYCGFTTNLSYEAIAQTLGDIAFIPDMQTTKSTSFLGKVLVGEDILSNTPKVMKTREFTSIKLDDLSSQSKNKINLDLEDNELIQIQELDNVNLDAVDILNALKDFNAEEETDKPLDLSFLDSFESVDENEDDEVVIEENDDEMTESNSFKRE